MIRRAIVQASVLQVLLFASGCSTSSEEPGEPAVPRPPDVEAQAARAACEYDVGAPPSSTLGESEPIGKRIPVDHIFLLMLENRSFDHYFSKLPQYGQPDVTVADESFTNLDQNGVAVAWHKTDEYCIEDPAHGWAGSHRQWNAGKNDGFVLDNEPGGARAMGYLDHTDLPFYYELATKFAIGDRYFSSMLGPTWPNRMFFYSGSSHGLTKNTLPTDVNAPSIFSALIERRVEWKVYRSNLPPAAMFLSTWLDSVKGCSDPEAGACRLAELEELFGDLAKGKLPPVTFIDPEYSTGIYETSEHPPGNPHYGQHFTWRIVDALTKSPLWKRSVLFITYDEHGGFADHVPPPSACHPGNGEPEDTTYGTFDRLGFRVPLIVVSPYAKKGFVSHVDRDHTAVLRFVQARHGIGAFSRRDANSDALMDLFDFDAPPHLVPPQFPEPVVDPVKVAECEQAFPGGK